MGAILYWLGAFIVFIILCKLWAKEIQRKRDRHYDLVEIWQFWLLIITPLTWTFMVPILLVIKALSLIFNKFK